MCSATMLWNSSCCCTKPRKSRVPGFGRSSAFVCLLLLSKPTRLSIVSVAACQQCIRNDSGGCDGCNSCGNDADWSSAVFALAMSNRKSAPGDDSPVANGTTRYDRDATGVVEPDAAVSALEANGCAGSRSNASAFVSGCVSVVFTYTAPMRDIGSLMASVSTLEGCDDGMVDG